ncbi:MAG TPA: tRNA 2-thiouridine(34) synthase MnmA [Nitriliruptorales bacterium]|nr:tRNA 2-thiouridine(34) synthase MnmA [Nitriliruptorales bacterium]
MNVLVAMSGGVDSSVAAALLTDRGHDVTGVHLKLADVPLDRQRPGQGCCTLDDAQDARRVAQLLDIPFYVWDLREPFRRSVQGDFSAAYAAGRTPNPCIACNREVKYAALLRRARVLGFDALATGHHVRLSTDGCGRYRLLRAADRAKDQTYVLYVATQQQLAHSLFPTGELTKPQVRQEAERRGLRVASKRDSYDLCFVPSGDTAAYLAERLPSAPGPVVDLDGTVLGEHGGVWRYTVGQRRGLALGTHLRRYVVHIDAARNTLVVGPRESLASRWADLGQVNWVPGVPPVGPVRAQIRAHAPSVPATLVRTGHGWRVEFAAPLEAVAEGQACVLYRPDDHECLGGGAVVAADRAAAGVG